MSTPVSKFFRRYRRSEVGVIALLLLATSSSLVGAEQDRAEDSALTWQWTAVPVRASAEKEVEIVADVDIAPGWVLYSSDFTPALFGPRPAKLKLASNAAYRAIGEVQAIQTKSGTLKDASGEAHYKYFSHKGHFRQRVTILDASSAKEIRGVIRGQTCFEEKGVCQLFAEEFAVAVN